MGTIINFVNAILYLWNFFLFVSKTMKLFCKQKSLLIALWEDYEKQFF